MQTKFGKKISLLKLQKKIGLLLIFFAPIDIYRIEFPFSNLSLFRVFFIVLIFFFFLQLILKSKIKKLPNIYFFLILSIFSLVIGLFQTISLQLSKEFILNEFMGVILIFLFVNIYTRNDLIVLVKTYIASLIIAIFFAIFVYYKYIINGTLVIDLPFTNKLSFLVPVTNNFKYALRSGQIPRLILPFSTSPHLALNLSLAIIYIFFFKRFYNHRKSLSIILLVAFLAVLIGTLTRSVLISLTLAFFLYFILQIRKKKYIINFSKRKVSIAIIVLSFFIVLFVIFFPTEIIEKLFARFSELGEHNFFNSDRHFLLIHEAFIIWLKNIKTFLVGIGIGNIRFQKGVYTYLPPKSMLNSFLTVLVERGIVGFVLLYSFYLYLFAFLLKSFQKYSRFLPYSFLFIMINILIVYNLYELRLLLGVWINLSFISIYVANVNPNQNKKIKQ